MAKTNPYRLRLPPFRVVWSALRRRLDERIARAEAFAEEIGYRLAPREGLDKSEIRSRALALWEYAGGEGDPRETAAAFAALNALCEHAYERGLNPARDRDHARVLADPVLRVVALAGARAVIFTAPSVRVEALAVWARCDPRAVRDALRRGTLRASGGGLVQSRSARAWLAARKDRAAR